MTDADAVVVRTTVIDAAAAVALAAQLRHIALCGHAYRHSLCEDRPDGHYDGADCPHCASSLGIVALKGEGDETIFSLTVVPAALLAGLLP